VLVADACILRSSHGGRSVTGEYSSVSSLSYPFSRTVGVHGVVLAKSPIPFGGSSKPAFVTELVDAAERRSTAAHALSIVFAGMDTVRWWPFVHEGLAIAVTSLRVTAHHSLGSRWVLRASSGATMVYDGEEDSAGLAVARACTSSVRASPDARSRFSRRRTRDAQFTSVAWGSPQSPVYSV
jgi:hypothetical protein